MRTGRILIAKPGLDGHDRGARYIVRLLREAGYEVLYTGIRRSPEQLVEAAIRNDVDAVGLSLLSGAHRVLCRRVLDGLSARGADSIAVFGGGIIPEEDVPVLTAMGMRAVFTPGTSAETIRTAVARLLSERVRPKSVLAEASTR